MHEPEAPDDPRSSAPAPGRGGPPSANGGAPAAGPRAIALEHSARPLWRDPRLALLLAFAAGLRLVLGLALWHGDPLARVPISDADYYLRWASALADGETFREGLPYWLPPLYPGLLAWLRAFAGEGLVAVLVAQGLVGCLNTALVARLGERVVDRRAGLAAGWLWTLYAPVTFFESRLLAVNAAVPLALVVLHLALSARDALERRPRSAAVWSVAAGLALGLASLARPNLMLAVVFLGAVLLAGRRAGTSTRTTPGERGARNGWPPRALTAAALAAGFLAGLAPSLLHNHAASGSWMPVTANGGVNFWFGNNAEAHGTFHAPGPEWGSIDAQRDVSLAIASDALGRDVLEPEASAWWFARGRTWLGEHPGAALRLWGLKLADSFSSTEFGIQYVVSAARAQVPWLWLCPLPFGLLAALAVLGWSGPARGKSVLVAWLLAGLAASLLYFTYSRFRLPLLVAALPFAGRGALRVLDALRLRARGTGTRHAAELRAGERLGGARLALALLVLAQSFVPFEGAYPRQLASNAFVDAALAWEQLGEPQRGERELERALEVLPSNAKALVELARRDLGRGDWSSAAARLDAADALGVDYPPLGDTRVRLWLTAPAPFGDPARGVTALRARLGQALGTEPATALSESERTRSMVVLASALLSYPELALDPGEARRLVEAALARDPRNSAAETLLDYLSATPPTSQDR